MGPTLGMTVKLAHKHKVDTSYKGALFRANLDSCELYYILVLSSCHAYTVPSATYVHVHVHILAASSARGVGLAPFIPE